MFEPSPFETEAWITQGERRRKQRIWQGVLRLIWSFVGAIAFGIAVALAMKWWFDR